jgi:hypothetical protein
MNIYDILEGKVVVYGDDALGFVVGWNGSCTFALFAERDHGVFDAIDIRTTCDTPRSLEHARMVAIEFVQDMMDAMNDEAA